MSRKPPSDHHVEVAIGDRLVQRQVLMQHRPVQECGFEFTVDVVAQRATFLSRGEHISSRLRQLLHEAPLRVSKGFVAGRVGRERTEDRPDVVGGEASSKLAGVAALAVGACSSDDDTSTSVARSTTERPTVGQPTAASESPDEASVLPEREGARRATTGDVPHVQLGATPVPAVDAELRRRVFQLPGVQDLPSDRSLPGARGLAFPDDFELARPDVVSGSSEFAHIHPDGSLHVWLPVERALEVHETKWGEMHPWVDREGFWDGVAMIYTPETLEELDITIRILVDAYNFVTGASLEPADIA